ncbi:MAG TPA: penicillin acylase family protein [Pyrinomonadaceae bacterium]
MRRAWKILRWVLVIVLLLAVLLSVGIYLYLHRSLPEVSGTIRLAGLAAPVDIIRDRDGVPHIYAQSKLDAFFGLGFAHAQDRLWQMEFQRRVGQGRLSEIVGQPTVSTDRFIRILGVYRASQSAWQALPSDARRIIEAYVNGVNAFIGTHAGSRLPPEFTILGVRPEPWTGPDVLVWAKMMAFNLGGTFQIKLLRLELARVVGAERAAQLLPDSPADDLSIVQSVEPLPDPKISSERTGDSKRGVASASGSMQAGGQEYALLGKEVEKVRTYVTGGNGFGSGIGSNSWVVDGSKSTTGKPLLANDPHLEAQLPSTWYLAHLSAEDMDVTGATIPGLPGVVIGRNRSIAWGITNLFPDTQDLFSERLDPGGLQVEFEGRLEPVQVIKEIIKVKDQPSIEQSVRLTRHGPLISDALNADNEKRDGDTAQQSSPPLEPLALRWPALDAEDATVAGFIQLNTARNWTEFKQALSGYVAPALSYVYADVEGNIGYYAAGRFPLRPAGDGSAPADGSTSRNEWSGWVPANAAPQVYNPPQHLIVTANNRPVPVNYPYFFGRIWEKPYRARRIAELLNAKDKLSPDDMAAIQSDTVSLQARELLPELLSLAAPQDEDQRKAIELLRGWDGNMTQESAAAAIFAAWYRRLPSALIDDELGHDLATRYGGWSDLFVRRFLVNTLHEPTNAWCDNVATPQREDCRQVVDESFKQALQDLRSKLGVRQEQWQWGSLHQAVFFHQPFGYVDYIRRIFNRSIRTGGDNSTINLGEFSFDSSFEQHAVSSYRQVIDLANADTGKFILAIGQSGHLLSTHYADYLDDWQAVRYRPMRFEKATILREQEATLRLEPDGERK